MPNQPNDISEPGDFHAGGADRINPIDLAFSRIVDRRASRRDWDTIEAAAGGDASVWRELALTQRDAMLLEDAVKFEIACAARIAAPSAAAVEAAANVDRSAALRTRSLRLSAWSGWAVAAMVALGFFGNRMIDERTRLAALNNAANATPSNTASLLDVANLAGSLPSDQLRDLYMTKGKSDGRVVGEVPTRVVQRVERIPGTNSFQVTFIRPIIERETVDNLYQITSDEAGNASAVRIDFARGPALGPSM